jgi:hypothetical protein
LLSYAFAGVEILQYTGGNCTFPSDKKLEDAENCARYYDCENKISEGKAKLTECPFPLSFDAKSQRCDHFSMVQCGTRYEPKDVCKLHKHKHILYEINRH